MTGRPVSVRSVEWPPYNSAGRVFVEITRSDHGHGGPGWAFGTCLWSPSRNRAGADRYSIMREPSVGNTVLHFYAQAWPDGRHDSRLAGRSVVAKSVAERKDEPPSPGDWAGMAPYYRVDLQNYQSFPVPLPLRRLLDDYGDEVRGDIANTQPRFYPFNRWGTESGRCRASTWPRQRLGCTDSLAAHSAFRRRSRRIPTPPRIRMRSTPRHVGSRASVTTSRATQRSLERRRRPTAMSARSATSTSKHATGRLALATLSVTT